VGSAACYDNSYDKCCKTGKFSLVDKLLGSAWNLSQTMQPDLIHTLSVCMLEYRPLLICTDPGWIPLGECAPIAANNCALEIPLSEFGCDSLKLSALGSFVMGREGFPDLGLVNSLEPYECLLKSCALIGQLLCP
jgi:hypothetical protein